MSSKNRQNSSLKGNLLLLLASLIFSAVLVEIGARLFLPAVPAIEIRKTDYQPRDRSEGLNYHTVHEESASGQLRLSPNIDIIIKDHPLSHQDIPFQTNSLGFRSAELLEKEASDYRVLVLGDSIVLGDYVLQEHTFPAVLERYLNKNKTAAFHDRNFQVINAAVGSIDLQNELEILFNQGLAAEPDLVLIALFLNDAHRSLVVDIRRAQRLAKYSAFLGWLIHQLDIRRSLRKSRKEDHRNLDYFRSQFVASNQIDASPWWAGKGGFNKLVHDRFFDWGYAWSAGFWERVTPLIKVARDAGGEYGFKLAVVILPVAYQVHSALLRDEPQAAFSSEMSRLGVPHHDVLPVLRQSFLQKGSRLYYDYCHLTPEGNKILGEDIGQFLLGGAME